MDTIGTAPRAPKHVFLGQKALPEKKKSYGLIRCPSLLFQYVIDKIRVLYGQIRATKANDRGTKTALRATTRQICPLTEKVAFRGSRQFGQIKWSIRFGPRPCFTFRPSQVNTCSQSWLHWMTKSRIRFGPLKGPTMNKAIAFWATKPFWSLHDPKK